MTRSTSKIAHQFAREANYFRVVYSHEEKGWDMYYLFSNGHGDDDGTGRPMLKVGFKANSGFVNYGGADVRPWVELINRLRGL